jgi:hypothetical protein
MRGDAFVGEIASGPQGGAWRDLDGRDKTGDKQKIFQRLEHLARKGYKLALIWPNLEWRDVDPRTPANPDKPVMGKGPNYVPMTDAEFFSKTPDPLKLSPDAREGITDFTKKARYRDGIPDPLP